MKKLEFETNKSRFVIVDNKDFPKSLDDYSFYIEEKLLIGGIKLSEITEEQASDIVDEPVKFFNPTNPYCVEDVVYIDYTSREGFWTAIESLHSLLESKGVHLFKNPYISKINPLEYKEAKEKTFYNPYIFKI